MKADKTNTGMECEGGREGEGERQGMDVIKYIKLCNRDGREDMPGRG